MGWSDPPRAATRREVHFGDRVVRCFADRPADTYAVFERALARCATKEAIVAGELRLTYRDLGEIVERTAAGFAQLGVRANDRSAPPSSCASTTCPRFTYAMEFTRLGCVSAALG